MRIECTYINFCEKKIFLKLKENLFIIFYEILMKIFHCINELKN